MFITEGILQNEFAILGGVVSSNKTLKTRNHEKNNKILYCFITPTFI